MAKKKYSYNEKKAYYIGYGMGLVSNFPSDDVGFNVQHSIRR